ncbi:DUF3267 domain-containing protein [Clostridium sp. Cult1]|uniref:DUF3267 domain-containing protein n=1 Tax=Clostridium sp. Cult1 TaxID=2079002 RepID=UPI001F445CE2|nr:hypothetical protein [Clostridium sp. Cult1]
MVYGNLHIICFFIHEVLHGIGFKFIGRAKWKDIRIGFHRKLLAPYCSCRGLIMSRRQYIGIMLLPNIILSLVILIIIVNSYNLFWGFIAGYVLGSGAGDYYMAIKILKFSEEVRFEDHSAEAGFYVYY